MTHNKIYQFKQNPKLTEMLGVIIKYIETVIIIIFSMLTN